MTDIYTAKVTEAWLAVLNLVITSKAARPDNDPDTRPMPGDHVLVVTDLPRGVAASAEGRYVLMPGHPLPNGWEWHHTGSDSWKEDPLRFHRTAPVEVRPIRLSFQDRWKAAADGLLNPDPEVVRDRLRQDPVLRRILEDDDG